MSDMYKQYRAVGTWLDKLCLGPIKLVPGCSRLCNACLRVLQHSESPLRIKHLRYWTTLKSSADRGCRLCIYLLEHWYEDLDDHSEIAHVESFADVSDEKKSVSFNRTSYRFSGVLFEFVNPACPACKSKSMCNPIQVTPRLKKQFQLIHSQISKTDSSTQ